MPLSEASTKAEILAVLRSAMEGEFGFPPERIQPGTHLIDDLDLDSLDFVDLTVSLDETNGLKLAEEQLEGIRTVQDAVDAIHSALRHRGAART